MAEFPTNTAIFCSLTDWRWLWEPGSGLWRDIGRALLIRGIKHVIDVCESDSAAAFCVGLLTVCFPDARIKVNVISDGSI